MEKLKQIIVECILGEGGVGTRLACIDTVVVLCRIAAAVLGLVIKSFLEMIHASLTAGTKHKKDCFRNRNKANINQGLLIFNSSPDAVVLNVVLLS